MAYANSPEIGMSFGNTPEKNDKDESKNTEYDKFPSPSG